MQLSAGFILATLGINLKLAEDKGSNIKILFVIIWALHGISAGDSHFGILIACQTSKQSLTYKII